MASLSLNAQGSLGGLEGASYGHMFQVQEFRRPEYEVTASNETSGPYFAGGRAVLAVEAKYYAGGALPDADVTWEVRSSPGHYSPPNWPDFVFGEWRPWWEFYRYDFPGPDGDTQTEIFNGRTGSDGKHLLQLDFNQPAKPDAKPQPISIVAQATVMDVNRQAWSSSTSLLVHPADLYVGLRSARYFVEKGTPLKVDFIVTDLDGNPVSGRPVVITAARLEWKLNAGTWNEEEVDIQECRKTSGPEPDACSFETPIGGSYRITAVVTDEQGRKNQTRFTRWVSGGQRPPARNVEQEQVTLVPDKQTYQPGDTAQILVQSPFSPAEGLLTVSRSGFLYTTRFQVENGSTTLSVPIQAEYIPNLNIQVDLVGSAPREVQTSEFSENSEVSGVSLPPRPAFATAQLNLSIPPLQRTLSLQVKPDASQVEPGGETTLRVTLKDADGQPVPDAELAVVVVDEAILALTDYQMVDPLSIFYSERESGVMSLYARSSIILANPQAMLEQAAGQRQSLDGRGGAMPTMSPAMAEAPAPMANKAAAQPTAISVRSDFNPLAAFAPTVRTASNGEASLFIKVPDNLTRYRVMVVAVDDTGRRFGMGESNLTARLPLMVRPSAPRFLNFGDRFELPVILQNQTGEPLTVEVVARATNLELQNAGLRVTVPANDRIEVRFPASTQMAGTARIQIAAISGTYADAAVVELPVYTPATTEAFATYGVIDDGALAQPVLYPGGVFPQYGGLEISTSSTALQALTDAVLYLVSYPFECSEQLASRILAVAALRDVLTAFEADGLPAPAEMEAAVTRDLQRLQGLQNSDGGFPYWRRGFESIPFNTIHVAHALQRAVQKGFEVPAGMQQGALNYLREIESHYPAWYDQHTRWTLSAYALYVRSLSGDRDAQKAQQLLRDAGIDNLSMEAIGWLWPVIDNESQLEEIRTFVNNHVVETAGAANFTTAYDDQTYLLLSSDRRTDAILLDALIEDNPQSDLIPKVVTGLLAHRTKGRWENTQENVFVLLGLDRYFNTYEAATPDFVARFWLGDTYAGSNEFRGRSTDIHETLIPMNAVLSETASAGGTQDLILSKEGPGRLYYRLGLRYAPTDLSLKALDMGFVVQRKYEALDDPADVSQGSDGVWHIKAGARLRVHITLVADNRRYHVALVDPLPAGLEIVNPALAVSQGAPQEDPSTRPYGWWWWGTWYEHQNLRDDRAEAFTSAALGWRVPIYLHRPCHHARHVRGPAGESGRDVLARGVRPQQQRLGDRKVESEDRITPMLARLTRIYHEFPSKFWVVVLVSFIDRIGGTLLFPFFSLYITQKFNVGMTRAGIILGVLSAFGLVGNMLGGALTDRFGRRRLILFGLVFSALSTLSFGLANSLAVLYPLIVVIGLLSNVAGPAHDAMIADLLPEKQRSEGFGILRVAANLAWIIGPTIGGLVAARSFFMLFVIDSVMSCIVALLFYKFIPETRPAAPAEISRNESVWQTMAGYRHVLRDFAYMAFLLASMLMLVVYQQMYNTLPVYLRDTHGFTPSAYGFFLTTSAITVVLFQFWVTRRIKHRPPFLMMALGTAFYVIGFTMIGFISAYVLFLLASVIITIGEMIQMPTSQALAANFAPLEMRGRYMAVFGLCWAIPSMIGPGAAGWILDNFNPNLLWYGGGILCVLSTLSFLALQLKFGSQKRFATKAPEELPAEPVT